MALSQREIDCYEREGLVIPDFKLPRNKLDTLRGALDEEVLATARLYGSGVASMPALRYMVLYDRGDDRLLAAAATFPAPSWEARRCSASICGTTRGTRSVSR